MYRFPQIFPKRGNAKIIKKKKKNQREMKLLAKGRNKTRVYEVPSQET